MLSPETGVIEAWRALVDDPEGCAVVARGDRPLAVVTRERLAERWPCTGPWTLHHTTLAEVAGPLAGVESLAPHEGLLRATRLLLASGLPALPVRSETGRLCGVVTVRTALSALVDVVGGHGRPAGRGGRDGGTDRVRAVITAGRRGPDPVDL